MSYLFQSRQQNQPRNRPWQRPRASSSGARSYAYSEGGPLIHEELVDFGSQRLIATSIFMVIQAYKFYEISFPKSAYALEMLPIKYLFVEGLYIWILWFFRIPWLTFSMYTNIMFSVLGFFVNLAITSTVFSVWGILGALWKAFFQTEYTLEGTKVKVGKDANVDLQSFHGAYTVKLLPESIATWNPSGNYYCVDKELRPVVQIPLEFNTTLPLKVDIAYRPFGANVNPEESILQFTVKDIVNYDPEHPPDVGHAYAADDSKFLAPLPVTAPGIYRVVKVVDKAGYEARVIAKDAYVTTCPQANFLPQSPTDHPGHECYADVDYVDIELHGIAPMTLTYELVVAGKPSVKTLESIEPAGFSSSFLNSRIPPYLGPEDLERVVAPSSVNVSIDTALTEPGEWLFTLSSVKDGLGNEVQLATTRNSGGFLSRLTSGLVGGGRHSSSEFDYSLEHSFIVHPRPQISFRGCSVQNPLVLIKDSVSLDFDLVGSVENGPYELHFDHTNPDDNTVTPHVFTWRNQKDSFKVTEPGTYTLNSISGKYCGGDIKEPSTCLVYIPMQPDISVDFVPIRDSCAGAIGLTADIRFSGTPPYKVGYRISHEGDNDINKIIVSDQSRHQIDFTPDKNGLYRYEFNMYGDSIYGEIKLNEPKVMELETFPLASAEILKPKRQLKCCSGDSMSFDIALRGLPPFKLTYEIVGPVASGPIVVEGINSYTYTLEVPPFYKGGVSKLLLLSVEDERTCKTELEDEVSVEVRRERPSASFLSVDGSMTKQTIVGSVVDIPLAATGDGPFEITYQFINNNGEVQEQIMSLKSKNSKLSVREAGLYRLIKVQDSYCPGQIVARHNEFTVEYYNMPSVRLRDAPLVAGAETVIAPVCQYEDSSVPLVLEGKAPFELQYDVKGPTRERNKKINVGTTSAGLKLYTNNAGEYTYTIKAVADAFYDLSSVQNKQVPLVFKQTVKQRPTAVFAKRGFVYQVCANLHDGDNINETLDLKLTGEPPFVVSLNMVHEQTGQSFKKLLTGITTHNPSFTDIFKELKLGHYHVTIEAVSDATSCSSVEFSESEVVHLVAAELPSVSYHDIRSDYCVGERISIPLSGAAPFEIVYEFQGKKQKATSNSPFSRLASHAGNLTLISLSDSASACYWALDEMIPPIRIHDKPTVKVDESLSNQMIRGGDEAELVFVFTGTPPFSFTYARTEIVGNPPRRKILDSHTVNNIFGHTYKVRTTLPGNYEPTAIEDAYCAARNI